MKKVIYYLGMGIILFLTSLCLAQELPLVKEEFNYNYLSDLSPIEASSVYSFNKDPDGDIIRLDYTEYEKGICMVSDSEMALKLEGNFAEFNAMIGIGDKHFDYKGKLTFEVSADGEKIYGSKPLGPGEVNGFKLPIENVKELTLIVRSTNKKFTDFAVWANAFVK